MDYLKAFFIAITVSCFPNYTDAAIQTDEAHLQAKLFGKHNRFIIPLKNKSRSIKVEYDFQLIRIIDVNERNQYIKTYAWVNQYWRDELLTWDPKKYGGVDQIHVSPQMLWVPDILLYNNVDEEDRLAGGYNTYKTQVSLTHDGNVTWLNPAIFKSVCQIDVTYFPFDDQTCELKFGSWSYDVKRIDMYAKPNYVGLNQNYIANGEWKLLKIAARRNTKKYVCCPNEFVDVAVTFTIRRESIDYILKLIIPCALISSMIFLGFILPPESGERIGLSITVLLAMTVFQQFTSEIMPSYGFPLLGQYYFATIIQIGLSLLVTTTNLNFYHRSKSRMPKVLRKVINEWLYCIVFPYKKDRRQLGEVCKNCLVVPRDRCESSSDRSKLDSETELSPDNEDFHLKYELSDNDPWIRMEDYKKHEEQKISGLCRESLLQDENETYDKSKISFKIENPGSDEIGQDISANHLQVKTCSGSEHLLGEPQLQRGSPRIDRNDLIRRASFMSTGLPNSLMMAAMDITDEQVQHQEEWMKAARVLDRLFLILSILSGVITLLAIFLRAPRFANPE